jgi:hypothetical protein
MTPYHCRRLGTHRPEGLPLLAFGHEHRHK